MRHHHEAMRAAAGGGCIVILRNQFRDGFGELVGTDALLGVPVEVSLLD